MSLPDRLPNLPGLPGLDQAAALALLRRGELDIQGRLEVSSNSALYCLIRSGAVTAAAIYKPVRFERPLWDFPDETLARPRGRRGARLRRVGLGHRAADGPPRRSVRTGDGPALDRHRSSRSLVGPRPDLGHAAATDGDLRRRRQQHGPQGRPHPAGLPRWARVAELRGEPGGEPGEEPVAGRDRRRAGRSLGPAAPPVRRGPRGVLLRRAEAAHGPLGVAGQEAARRRAGRARDASGRSSMGGSAGGSAPCSSRSRSRRPASGWTC